MIARRARLASIVRLLERAPVPSHEALRLLLAEQGVEATQATLSRDLREIGAVKGPEGYTMPAPIGRATAPAPAPLPPLGLVAAVRSFVTSTQCAGALVVLRTGPGHASLVAAELDRDPPAGSLGTIAGDDTIFIACRSGAAARRIAATFSGETSASGRPSAGRARRRRPARTRTKPASKRRKAR